MQKVHSTDILLKALDIELKAILSNDIKKFRAKKAGDKFIREIGLKAA